MTAECERPWPTREEWAERTRTLYCDEESDWVDNHVSTRLLDYASEEELQAITLSLKERYKELGRLLRGRNAEDDYHGLQWRRRRINRTLKQLYLGVYDDLEMDLDPCEEPIFVTIRRRYEEACRQAVEEATRRKASLPIDDAAWEKELERRRELECYRSDPGSRLIR